MVSNRNKVLGLGGLALAGAVAVVLANSAFAQSGGGQGGGFGGGVQGGQGMAGRMGMGMQPMMGAPSSMVADDKNIFVLQGNRLFKVKKSDLSIEAEKQIGGQRPQQGGNPGNMPPLE